MKERNEIMETWNDIIFSIIQTHNDNISLSEIYKSLKTNPCVTAYHYQPWKPGGQPRYECWARKCISNLVRAGRIKRVGRALYSVK
jgi:hypothetical protein